MAIDEVLLQTTASALLRFYRWQEPTVSFGYFSPVKEARVYAGERAIVRRWTGGGIVPHGDDLTYSIIIPAAETACAFSSRAIYHRVHEAIGRALGHAGIQATLAAAPAAAGSQACFERPVLADLMRNGRKIAGAAHRRTRAGLLHQGSIQSLNAGGALRANMAQALATCLVQEQEISPVVLERATPLAREKYASENWTARC